MLDNLAAISNSNSHYACLKNSHAHHIDVTYKTVGLSSCRTKLTIGSQLKECTTNMQLYCLP